MLTTLHDYLMTIKISDVRQIFSDIVHIKVNNVRM